LWIRASRIHFISPGLRDGSVASKKKALKLGDYSVAGLEAVCAVERKDLSDLVHSCTVDRCGSLIRQALLSKTGLCGLDLPWRGNTEI
jgi:ERCC4-type nuclease